MDGNSLRIQKWQQVEGLRGERRPRGGLGLIQRDEGLEEELGHKPMVLLGLVVWILGDGV